MASGVVAPASSGLKTGLWANWLSGSLLLGALQGIQLGCGGAAPLLHPAQTLPVGGVSVGAGVSGQFGSSSITRAIDRGRSAAGQPLSDPGNATAYVRGVLTDALLAPGASPWVSARAGVAENLETGLSYTGRSLRLDGRYALELDETWTLSVGVGATGLLLTPERGRPRLGVAPGTPDDPRAELEPRAKGWGADLPVLIGVRLLEGFGDVWLGPRFGFERLSGNLHLDQGDPASSPVDVSANRTWAGLVAGFSLGIPPLWLRFELATTYHRLSGSLKASAGSFDAAAGSGLDFDTLEATGWTFTPSGAIVGKF